MNRYLFCLFLLLAVVIQTAQGATQTQKPTTRDVLRGFHLRYNRVEGPFAGYQLKLAPKSWKGVSVWAETGYGTKNQTIRWATGMGWANVKYTATFTVFDRTETNDSNTIQTAENSLFAFLYKGDYRDYFHAQNGFEGQVLYRFNPGLRAYIRLIGYAGKSMPVVTQWSLFRNDTPFRPNPAILPGNVGLLQLGTIYDTRRHTPRFRNAWFIQAFYERGFRDFPFNGLQLKVTRHQKTIWGNQAFIFNGQLATREHTAEQFLFDLGGVGTLRGYDIKEFTGNRMVMLNIDYLFRGDIFNRIPVPGAHLLNLILFADTGWTDTAPKTSSLFNGFQTLTVNNFKTNVGVAIGFTERLFRFNIARRLDNGDWAFSARFFREF